MEPQSGRFSPWGHQPHSPPVSPPIGRQPGDASGLSQHSLPRSAASAALPAARGTHTLLTCLRALWSRGGDNKVTGMVEGRPSRTVPLRGKDVSVRPGLPTRMRSHKLATEADAVTPPQTLQWLHVPRLQGHVLGHPARSRWAQVPTHRSPHFSPFLPPSAMNRSLLHSQPPPPLAGLHLCPQEPLEKGNEVPEPHCLPSLPQGWVQHDLSFLSHPHLAAPHYRYQDCTGLPTVGGDPNQGLEAGSHREWDRGVGNRSKHR